MVTSIRQLLKIKMGGVNWSTVEQWSVLSKNGIYFSRNILCLVICWRLLPARQGLCHDRVLFNVYVLTMSFLLWSRWNQPYIPFLVRQQVRLSVLSMSNKRNIWLINAMSYIFPSRYRKTRIVSCPCRRICNVRPMASCTTYILLLQNSYLGNVIRWTAQVLVPTEESSSPR